MIRFWRVVMLPNILALLLSGFGCKPADAPPASGKTAPPPPEKATTRPAAPSVNIQIEATTAPRIVLEAEAGTIQAPMEKRKDENASGGEYVEAPEGPEHQELSIGGSVTLPFKVTAPGNYELWLRVWWCCSCGNSLDLKLDGEDLGYITNNNLRVWQWMRCPKGPFTLSAGEHVLVVGNREDGSRLDQVLFIADSEYVPAGIER